MDMLSMQNMQEYGDEKAICIICKKCKRYAHTHQVYTHTLFLYDTYNQYDRICKKKYAEYAHTPFLVQKKL
jgi:hypothetical protein